MNRLLAIVTLLLLPVAASALNLEVKDKEKTDSVVLFVSMSQQEYDTAKGSMGHEGQPVTNDSLPGANAINLKIPMTIARYREVKMNASQQDGTGPDWCVTCAAQRGTAGEVKFTQRARHAFAAAVIATSLCSGMVGSPDNSVQGPGACSLPKQK